MDIGYARVSTDDQRLDLQLAAFERVGITRFYTDKMSGKTMRWRPGLDQALSMLRPGDSLVVWRLDRLGRSLIELSQIAERLKSEGIGLRSLTESFDTTSAMGQMMFGMLGVFAQFERNLLAERTRAGLDAARARGSVIGRKPKLTEADVAAMEDAVANTNRSLAAIASDYGISKTALYAYIPGGRQGLLERRAAADRMKVETPCRAASKTA